MDLTWQPSTEILRLCRLCMSTISLARSGQVFETNPENSETKKIEIHFPALFALLLKTDLTKLKDCTTKVLPNLIILYLQRSKVNNWNSARIVGQAQTMNSIFKDKYGVNLYDLFIKSEEKLFSAQELFDNTMMELNLIIQTSDNIRKYPLILAVYFKILERIKDYGVHMNPMKVCPISVLQIDDYDLKNKANGLKCLVVMMQLMTEKDFEEGNYYEVIFESLKQSLNEKDIEVTIDTLTALMQFLNHIVPEHAKIAKRDEIYAIVLEMILMETNLRRKKELFLFLKVLVESHKVNCVSRKLLKKVFCDNIHVCCNDAVADILLVYVLECMQAWIKNCWCTWKLSTDHELISALIKLLYVNRKEKIAKDIQNLILTLITLCTTEERVFIKNNLNKCKIKAPEFKEKLDEIINEIEIDVT